MARKYTYHRENCDSVIRDVVTDILGRTIVLSGKHAFEWSITICTKEMSVKTVYPSSKEAKKAFYRFKKKK